MAFDTNNKLLKCCNNMASDNFNNKKSKTELLAIERA